MDLLDEIWSRVFACCREEARDSGDFVAQPSVAKLMLVSARFQRLAAPVLYGRVVVRNFNSFFLGSLPPSLPPAPQASSPRVIHKNELLRYVKELHAVKTAWPYPINTSAPPSQEQMEVQHRFFLKSIAARQSLLDFLHYLVDPIPTLLPAPSVDDTADSSIGERQPALLLPQLSRIRICESTLAMGYTGSNLQDISLFFLKLAAPTAWCGSSVTLSMYSSPTSTRHRTAKMFTPQTVYSHSTRVDLDIIPGINNVIYLNQDPGAHRQIRAMYGNDFDIGGMLVLLLSSAIARLQYGESPVQSAAGRNDGPQTTLLIYGLVPIDCDPNEVQPDDLRDLMGLEKLDSDGEIENEARGRATEINDMMQKKVRDFLRGTGEEIRRVIKPDAVVLKMAWEAEDCPCCGQGCRTVQAYTPGYRGLGWGAGMGMGLGMGVLGGAEAMGGMVGMGFGMGAAGAFDAVGEGASDGESGIVIETDFMPDIYQPFNPLPGTFPT